MRKDFFDQKHFGPYINNEQIETDETIDHDFLMEKEKGVRLSFAGPKEVTSALEGSEMGKATLANLNPHERAEILHKMADLLRSHADPIGQMITREMGKTIRDAKGEVEYAANYFDWYAEEGKRVYGYTVPSHISGKEILVQHAPVGTVAVITPWNFPIAMGARKIAPAIAAGCASIVRPSTDTALSMLTLGAIAQEAGLPAGALQIIPGDPVAISTKLLSDFRVRKLTFTGSTEVGKLLYSQSTSTLKKVTLELGGHAPVLVFDDADLEKAAEEAIKAKLRVSGQTCVCANRIYVQKKSVEPFVALLKEKLSKLKMGNPLDESTDLTNVLHPTSQIKVPKQIKDAIGKGANCEVGGGVPHEPTILTGVTPEMTIYTEETFGPVFPIIPFETEEEGIAHANNTIYGLAAYLFTTNVDRVFRVTKALEYGIIGVNNGLPTSFEAPFGGVKSSGFGREGGPTGIYEYLTEKTISIAWTR